MGSQPSCEKKKKRTACWGVLGEKTLFAIGRTKIQWGWSVLLGCTLFLVNLLMAVVRWQSLGTRNGGVRLFAWCVDATSIKIVVTFGREEELSGSHFAALKIKFCPTLFFPGQTICAAGPMSQLSWLIGHFTEKADWKHSFWELLHRGCLKGPD